MNKNKNPSIKVTLLGDSNTGKSSIVNRKVYGKFDENIPSSIGTAFNCIKTCDYIINLWDTAGQERFRSILPIYLRGSDICLIVYDITNDKSKKAVDYWIDQVENLILLPKILIIGNKCDLIEKIPNDENDFNYPVIFTSAKTGFNIDEIFNFIINMFSNSNNNNNKNNEKFYFNFSLNNLHKFSCYY
jgi:Ras-related protein Rab-6A